MRSILVAMVTLLVTFGSTVNKAQVMQLPRPAPQVTAATADWQVLGEPIFFAGDLYYPSIGPNIFFDGFSMVPSGSYQGIPLYTDTSIEPYRIVYVPIGRNAMRPYERRAAVGLAGADRIDPRSLLVEQDTQGLRQEPPAGGATLTAARFEPSVGEAPRPVGTRVTRTITPRDGRTGAMPPAERPARLLIQSIPAPRSNVGVWLEFNGVRWYSAGRAVPHIADQFVRIGSYRGLPVYRDTTRGGGDIYIPAVVDGPLAPYSQR